MKWSDISQVHKHTISVISIIFIRFFLFHLTLMLISICKIGNVNIL